MVRGPRTILSEVYIDVHGNVIDTVDVFLDFIRFQLSTGLLQDDIWTCYWILRHIAVICRHVCCLVCYFAESVFRYVAELVQL